MIDRVIQARAVGAPLAAGAPPSRSARQIGSECHEEFIRWAGPGCRGVIRQRKRHTPATYPFRRTGMSARRESCAACGRWQACMGMRAGFVILQLLRR